MFACCRAPAVKAQVTVTCVLQLTKSHDFRRKPFGLCLTQYRTANLILSLNATECNNRYNLLALELLRSKALRRVAWGAQAKTSNIILLLKRTQPYFQSQLPVQPRKILRMQY